MRRHFGVRLVLLLFCCCVTLPGHAQGNQPSKVLVIDASAPSHAFPHFWEKMFGSGRAILSLRDSYRTDLRTVKKITGFSYVRFYGILNDEVGIYDENAQGQPLYNFSYVDQIYDGLLANGVRPIVEISFMPNKLASTTTSHSFWYKPNVSPPKDWARWDGLISAFTQHLLDRYGVDEVSQWYFEVWNDPNRDSWVGQPKQTTYWDLYDHTALAIKHVNRRFRVGGPATAQAAWVDAFIRHCVEKNIPVDFASTHVYGNDSADDVLGSQEDIPRDQIVWRAVDKVHKQIKASSLPRLPLIWSEFNASYKNEPSITDSIFMGPWLANTIRQCDGLVDIMSYRTFSDVIEEQGVVKTPFYGGYGLIGADSIPKPAFNAFWVLHKLGEYRIQLDSDSAILTRRRDGTLALAVWNYSPPEQEGSPITLNFELKGTNPTHAFVWRVDHDHGDFHQAYAKMNSPRYPTPGQIEELRVAGQLPSPERGSLHGGRLTITLPSYGLALIELK